MSKILSSKGLADDETVDQYEVQVLPTRRLAQPPEDEAFCVLLVRPRSLAAAIAAADSERCRRDLDTVVCDRARTSSARHGWTLTDNGSNATAEAAGS